jgi:hypothetical protein
MRPAREFQSPPPVRREATQNISQDGQSATWGAISDWFPESHHVEAKKQLSKLESDSMTELGRLKSFCKLRTLAGENYKNQFSHRPCFSGIRVDGHCAAYEGQTEKKTRRSGWRIEGEWLSPIGLAHVVLKLLGCAEARPSIAYRAEKVGV